MRPLYQSRMVTQVNQMQDQTCHKQEMSQNNIEIQIPRSPPPGYNELFHPSAIIPLSQSSNKGHLHRAPPPPYPGNDVILDVTGLDNYPLNLQQPSYTMIDNDVRLRGYRSYRDYWRWRSM